MSEAAFVLLGFLSCLLQLYTVVTIRSRHMRTNAGMMAWWMYIGAVAYMLRGEIGWTAYAAVFGSVFALAWYHTPKGPEGNLLA